MLCSDVSWGTKGDNDTSTDLGVVQPTGPNNNRVEVVLPTKKQDIDVAYDKALEDLSQPAPTVKKNDKKPKVPDPSKQQEQDYYRSFRTQ